MNDKEFSEYVRVDEFASPNAALEFLLRRAADRINFERVSGGPHIVTELVVTESEDEGGKRLTSRTVLSDDESKLVFILPGGGPVSAAELRASHSP